MPSKSLRTRLQGRLIREIPGSAALAAILGALFAAFGIVLVWVQPRTPDGADPSIALSSMLESAQKLQQDGRSDDACSLADRAVRLSQATFGGDHPATAHAMNELAVMSIAARRYQGVEEMLHKVLTVHARVYGPVSPDVAVVIHNLAVLSEQTTDFPEAEQRYVRAIETYALSAEPDPGIAQSLINLAGIAELRGDYLTAERLHRRALDFRETLLGYSHMSTAESMAKLATVLLKQGNISIAERLHRRALAIREHVLGLTHVATASSMNGLALLLLQRGEIDAADPLALGALAIREHVYGERNPATASSLETLARVRQQCDEPAVTRRLLDRALAIRMDTNGPNHPKTADTLILLGDFFINCGDDYGSAVEAFAKAAAIRTVVLGETNVQTVRALEKQCLALRGAGQTAEWDVIEKRLASLKHKANFSSPDTTVRRGDPFQKSTQGTEPDSGSESSQ
jgi:tetratricopeptide (TPR) repeat protein